MNVHPFIRSLRRKIEKVKKRLENLKPLLKVWGLMGVSASQKAFKDQKFGGKEWPSRYPNQNPPKLNIAGVVFDFRARRSSPKPNRFEDRPALVDEGFRGGLWGSMDSNVEGDKAVEWGTSKPYATLHQEGGDSKQSVDDRTKDLLAQWMFSRKGYSVLFGDSDWVAMPAGWKHILKSNPNYVRKKAAPYVDKLMPLFGKSELVTKVHPRPFYGITPDMAVEMVRAGEWFIATGNPEGGTGQVPPVK